MVPGTPLSGPVPVGNEFTCTPIHDNGLDPVASYAWHFKYDYGGNRTLPWTAVGSNETLTSSQSYPVLLLTIRLTVKYSSVFVENPPRTLPPHADTVITKELEIEGADNVKLPAGGSNVAAAWAEQIVLSHDVRCGTDYCLSIGGVAQERMTNRMFRGMPQPDIDWYPEATSPTFFLEGGSMMDVHWSGLDETQWNATAVDNEFQTATQELRIIWTDPCANLNTDQVLSTVSIVHKKTSSTQWKVLTN